MRREGGRGGWAGWAPAAWDEDEGDWGLIPGEDKGEEEENLESYVDVWEAELLEEGTVERIEGGGEVHGVWRNLLVKGDGGGGEVVGRWVLGRVELQRRAQEGAVMHGHCMKVVEAVRRFAGY